MEANAACDCEFALSVSVKQGPKSVIATIKTFKTTAKLQDNFGALLLLDVEAELVVQKIKVGETDRGPWHTLDLTKKSFPDRPTQL